MRSLRLVIPCVAFAAVEFVTCTASPQNRATQNRTAPRIEIRFQPSAVIAPKVDLRPQIEKFGLAIRDQGNRATCSVFATTFLIEYQSAITSGTKNIELSEEYLNWAKNRASKTDVDGGKFTDIISGYTQFGMVPIKDMPNQPAFHPKHPDAPTNSVIASGKKFARFRLTFIKQWDNQKGMSEKELEATTIFFTGEVGKMAMTSMGDDPVSYAERVSPVWPYTRIVLLGLCAALMLSSLVFAVVWMLRKLIGKMKGVPHLAVRWVPLLAVLCLLGIPFFAGKLDGAAIGTLNFFTFAIFLATILFPLLSLTGLVLALRVPKETINRGVRLHSLVVSLACCVVAAFLASWGLLGLRLWASL